MFAREDVVRRLESFFARKAEVVFAFIHGSFTCRDDYRDIDIALYCDPVPSSPLQYELNLETELITAGLLPGEPDVRLLNGAPLAFRYHTVKSPLMIFSRDDERFCDFKEDAIRYYLDFSRHTDMMLKDFLHGEVSTR